MQKINCGPDEVISNAVSLNNSITSLSIFDSPNHITGGRQQEYYNTLKHSLLQKSSTGMYLQYEM